jgi:hypothetical protein
VKSPNDLHNYFFLFSSAEIVMPVGRKWNGTIVECCSKPVEELQAVTGRDLASGNITIGHSTPLSTASGFVEVAGLKKGNERWVIVKISSLPTFVCPSHGSGNIKILTTGPSAKKKAHGSVYARCFAEVNGPKDPRGEPPTCGANIYPMYSGKKMMEELKNVSLADRPTPFPSIAGKVDAINKIAEEAKKDDLPDDE